MSHTGPILEGRGDTDYERYVRVPELLELQKPVDELSHPEERLFQVTHQAAELWLHHIDHEIGRVAAAGGSAAGHRPAAPLPADHRSAPGADRHRGDDGACRLSRHPHIVAGP